MSNEALAVTPNSEDEEGDEGLKVLEQNRSDNIWQKRANTFWPSNTSMDTKVLEPGVYSWSNSMAGWYLARDTHGDVAQG